MQTKYIFVVGGVISGVGKGVAVSSIARILKAYGYKTTCVKIDPYINVDAGTMNPTEHGEVFVTEDGDETDQDIGNYERFLCEDIYSTNYMTTGRVYKTVIEKERRLEYAGKCVEVVPHIPLEVISRIKDAGKATGSDIVVVEVGGTVGEYQNILFLEAARMMHLKNPEDVIFVLVSYLPIPKNIGEMKTKPTQYATITLNSAGIQPDFILCRAEKAIDKVRKEKLAVFCNVEPENVISAPDVDFIYEVPFVLEKEGIGKKILKRLKLEPKRNELGKFETQVKKIEKLDQFVKIGIVGKYFNVGDYTLADSYISVIEAIKHAAWANNVKPAIEWINSEEFEKDQKSVSMLKDFDGIIVPGGYGSRGVEGKINAIKYCRENKIPYLGLCYGMQLAVIEFARNVCGLKGANTTENDPNTRYPVINIQASQKELVDNKRYGGTNRLGAYAAILKDKSQVLKLYKETGRLDKDAEQIKCMEKMRLGVISKKDSVAFERHRHRYEVNPEYVEKMEKKGLIFSGYHLREDGTKLMEFIEIEGQSFRGTQGHPEFKSRLEEPAPLFFGLIRDAQNPKHL